MYITLRHKLLPAAPEQLKTRTAKLREMAKLADYLKTESQLESKELDDQNHELK